MSDLLFVEENEKLFDEISEREKSKWEEIGFVSSGREHWFDTFLHRDGKCWIVFHAKNGEKKNICFKT